MQDLHSGRIMSMVMVSSNVGLSTPATGCRLVPNVGGGGVTGPVPADAAKAFLSSLDCPASNMSKRPFHHLFKIVARRSKSSGASSFVFVLDGWCDVLRRKGTSVDRTTFMRMGVEFLATNLENSLSSVRKVDHSGSPDVGCGIVMLVSAVEWDACSEVAAVTMVSRDEFLVVDGASLLLLETSCLASFACNNFLAGVVVGVD